MKVNVKTGRGDSFEIQVNPQDTVVDVKKNIENLQGAGACPASQMMIIYQGKVLKDGTTLEENKVAENSFVVVMLNKSKVLPGAASTPSALPLSQAQPANMLPPGLTRLPSQPPAPAPMTPTPPPAAITTPVAAAPAPYRPSPATPPPILEHAPALCSESDTHEQATSNLVAENDLETTIQQIFDMGRGRWDRDAVICALGAAFNNPERAVEYLQSGIPEKTYVPPVAQGPSPTTGGPNANPLDLFAQGLLGVGSDANAGPLDFLRNSEQFQEIRAMARANPQILEPLLQELGKQNPNLMRLILAHRGEFMRLINEPAEGDRDIINRLASAMPQAITVTAKEREAIERLEAMGFNRALAMEVFFACNKNEELAANYLLDHMHEFE